MDERQLRLRLGIVVLFGVLTTAILINQFGDWPIIGAGSYTVYVIFPEAPGISTGTPVRKSGVTIGRVTQWELMQPSGVRVTTSIESRYPILESEICRIASASVLGDAVLEFIPGPPGRGSDTPLLDGAVVSDGLVVGNPLAVLQNLESDAKIAMNSIRLAGDEVRAVAANLNNALGNNADQLPRTLQKAERAMDQFSSAMLSVQEVFGDQQTRDQLAQAFKDMPALIQESRATVQTANNSFKNFDKVSQRAETNLANLENFTRPLGERGAAIVQNLEDGLANANDLLEQLVDFSAALNDNEGTLGRLMNDPELYERLNRSMANIEDITRRARPVVDDLGIFADKLARDPRQLGVKGALDRRPSGAGSKYSTGLMSGSGGGSGGGIFNGLFQHNEEPMEFYEGELPQEDFVPQRTIQRTGYER